MERQEHEACVLTPPQAQLREWRQLRERSRLVDPSTPGLGDAGGGASAARFARETEA